MLAVLLLKRMSMKKRSSKRKLDFKENSTDKKPGVKEFCRTCLSSQALECLFSDKKSEKMRSEALKLVTGLEIKMDDGLSQKICTKCVEAINNALTFRRTSQRAQNMLQSMKSTELKPNTEKNSATPKAENNMAKPKAENNMATLKSEKNTATPKAENTTATPKAEKNMATLKAEKNMTTPKSENNMATPKAENNTATPNAENYTATPKVEQMVKPIAKRIVEKTAKQSAKKRATRKAEKHKATSKNKVAMKRFKIEMEIVRINDSDDDLHNVKSDVNVTSNDNSGLLPYEDNRLTDNDYFVNNGDYGDTNHSDEDDWHSSVNIPRKRKPRSKDVLSIRKNKCPTCNKQFKLKITLHRHMKFQHNINCTSAEYVVCELCGKKCQSNSVLQAHNRVHHGSERIHKCAYCEYSSTTKEGLVCHERLHTGEKPFVCDHCGSAFHRRPNLVQHIAIHEPVKKFQCNLCPKKEASQKRLNLHVYQRHTVKKYRYVCPVCSGIFGLLKNVRRHMKRIHHLAREDQGPVQRIDYGMTPLPS